MLKAIALRTNKMSASFEIDWRATALFLVLLFAGLACVVIGLVISGPRDDRLLPGGLCLAMSAITGMVAYFQVRHGKTPVPVDGWGHRMQWADKQDRPIRYWSTTIACTICTVVSLVFSVMMFAFSARILD
jgi:hypothetical protein